eukprot:604725-Alexandrium_andersonii.AAC.1
MHDWADYDEVHLRTRSAGIRGAAALRGRPRLCAPCVRHARQGRDQDRCGEGRRDRDQDRCGEGRRGRWRLLGAV